jgi:hypothetical protein
MAVSEYQAAYAHLRAVICGGAPPAPSNTPAGGPGTSTAVLRQQSMGGPGSHQGHTSVSSPSLPALAGLTPASSFSSYSPATTTGQLPLSPMPSPGGPGAGQPGAWGAAGVPLPMQPTHGHSASAVPALGGRPGTAGGFASTGGAGAGGPPQTASAAAGALTHSQSQAGIGGSGRGLSVTDSGAGGTAAAGGSARPPPTPQRFAQVGNLTLQGRCLCDLVTMSGSTFSIQVWRQHSCGGSVVFLPMMAPLALSESEDPSHPPQPPTFFFP